MTTELKEVPEFPGYFVDTNGLVYSKLRQNVLKLRKLRLSPNGMYDVNLYKRNKNGLRGRAYKRMVHQLVLEAFVGPKPENYVARHLNDYPLDNRLCNLKWGTRQENSDDCKINTILKSKFYQFIKNKYPHIIEEYNNMQNV